MSADTTLAGAFEAQVRRTPDRPAVRCGDSELTYRQLNARANRLARRLVARGAGPERFVAVALPRSTELPVALLAAVKAGAGYLPLDPALPVDRLAFMLADVDPVLVLTDRATAPALPAGTPLLVLDDAAPAEDGSDSDLTDADRTAPLRSGHPVFAIFTSGSTGRPKGVLIEHRSLLLYLAWARQAYDAVDGLALVHSPVSFDLTATGLYAPLTSGGCVELVDLEAGTGAGGADRPAPAFVKATPTHLALLAALPDGYSPTRQLVLGGEALLGEALDEWRRRHPDATVINEYGPTETTIGCMEFRIEPGDRIEPGVITLGRPIWQTGLHVLDASLTPVAAGETGELYISGGLLARGYHGRPGLTAGRFVASPYGSGERMYRTGDLVRLRADGGLDFIARTDDQVKLRGFRIELGEVEAALTGHPGVAHAAAVVREDQPGRRRLVGYVVAADGAEPDPEEVRAHAAAVLPEYMVPERIVGLPALPRTPNGKLDRPALPAPAAADATGRAAATDVEARLCALYAEVLQLPDVAADNGFFALGGDSIGAFALVRLAREAGLEFAARDVFARQTPAALAALVAAGPATATAPAPQRARTAAPRSLAGLPADTLVLPAAPLQDAMVRAAGKGPGPHTDQFGFALAGSLDTALLRRALALLARRHPALRVGFRTDEQGQVHRVLPAELELPLRELDLGELPEPERAAELERLLAADHAETFDPAEPPLLRCTAIRVAEGDWRLVLTLAPLLLDGWSLPLVMGELWMLYLTGADEAFVPPAEPAKPELYADWLADRDTAAAEAAWRTELAGLTGPTPLAAERPTAGTVTVAEQVRQLDEDLTARLTAGAREHGLTLNTVVSGAWALLLGRRTGRTEVVFGATVAGRPPELPGIDRTAGMFMNNLPVRIDWQPDEPTVEVLARLQARQAELIAHQHVSLARLRELAGFEELFDTLVAFESQPAAGPAAAPPPPPPGAPVGPGGPGSGPEAAAGAMLPPPHLVQILGMAARDAARLPLRFAVAPGAQLGVLAQYWTESYTEEQITELQRELAELLAALAADWRRPAGAPVVEGADG